MSTRDIVSSAVLRQSLIKTTNVAAILSLAIPLPVTASAVLQGFTRTVVAGAALRKTVLKTPLGNAVLLKTVARTFVGNVALKRRVTAAFTMNSVIKRGRKHTGGKKVAAGVEGVFSAGAVLMPMLVKGQLMTLGTMVIQRQGLTKTISASAVKVPQVLATVKTVTVSVSLSKVGQRLGVSASVVLTRSAAKSPKRSFSSFSARTSRR